MGRYKYTIPANERNKCHLIVSRQTHNVIVLYAKKWNITITEATQRILSQSIKNLSEQLVLESIDND